MKTLLLLLALTALAHSAPVTLAWDANTEPSVTAYELRYGTDPANLASTAKVVAPKTQVTVDVPPGIYHFEVVAITSTGLVSLPSNRVTHTVLPAAPKALRVVEIQTSSNEKDWRTVAFIPQRPDEIPAEFVRARIASITR